MADSDETYAGMCRGSHMGGARIGVGCGPRAPDHVVARGFVKQPSLRPQVEVAVDPRAGTSQSRVMPSECG